MIPSAILRNFDSAAATYDEAATVQAEIAVRLVDWAAESIKRPDALLDLGCGTGLVAKALHRCWPEAKIAAMDSSSRMLKETQRKLPQISILQSDALTPPSNQKFDAIFSSMLLHWLPDPLHALGAWQSWLKTRGQLFVALPVTGSFQEWRNLCKQNGVRDGLWVLPPGDFACDAATRSTHEDFKRQFPSARDFLQSMKATGAATARSGHAPISANQMRKLLNASPRPMSVTYRIAFLELPARSDP